MRTANDGGSWTIQAHVTDTLSSIACFSVSDCGAVATTTGAGGFLDTVDGGSLWSVRTTLGSAADEEDVACPAATTCYVAGGQGASVTVDGGQIWQALALPIDMQVASVSCLSATKCELAGGDNTTGVPAVLGTVNGGSTWSPQALPAASDGFVHALQAESLLFSVACAGTATCLAVGEASPVFISYYQFGFLLLSQNAGHTWASRPLAIGADSILGVACVEASCEALSDSPRGLVEGSVSQGVSWSPQAETVPSQGGIYRDVACASTLVCETVGTVITSPVTGTGTSLRTIDGGKAWRRTPLPSASDFYGISCPSVAICVAVGLNIGQSGPIMLRTTDGGARWSSVHLPAGTGQVVDVACTSTTHCEAVGSASSGGPLAIVTKNGTTWARQGLGKTAAVKAMRALSALSCPTALVCLAGGETLSSSGALMVTTDGGAIWRVEKAPAGAGPISDVACASAVQCEFVSSLVSKPGALAYGTTDTGTKWARQALPAGVEQLLALSCPSTAACIATGSTTSGVALILRLAA
jgi:photosystem II stability/assembly factor-like uncharacterized protein